MKMAEDIYKEYEEKLPKRIIEDIKKNVPEKTDKARLKKILEAVLAEYEKSKADAGECVGLISAQSIGEQQPTRRSCSTAPLRRTVAPATAVPRP